MSVYLYFYLSNCLYISGFYPSIYNYLSTYLYIHLSICLCIFLPKSEQLSRQKQTENVHCDVLSCRRTPQIYEIVCGTLDLFHCFLRLQWKTHCHLERLGRSPHENGTQVPLPVWTEQKGKHEELWERKKIHSELRQTMGSVRKKDTGGYCR